MSNKETELQKIFSDHRKTLEEKISDFIDTIDEAEIYIVLRNIIFVSNRGPLTSNETFRLLYKLNVDPNGNTIDHLMMHNDALIKLNHRLNTAVYVLGGIFIAQTSYLIYKFLL